MAKKLFFRYSTMNAGKSTLLLQTRYNYIETGLRVEVFTAEIDNRTKVGVVASRLGATADPRVFNKDFNFLEWVEQLEKDEGSEVQPISCILVDECQFLSRQQVQQLHAVAHLKNIAVICYGIRTDFRGVAFEGAAALLAIADELEGLKTLCWTQGCGRRASLVIRTDENGNRLRKGSQIEIGGNSRYRPVCGRCFHTL